MTSSRCLVAVAVAVDCGVQVRRKWRHYYYYNKRLFSTDEFGQERVFGPHSPRRDRAEFGKLEVR